MRMRVFGWGLLATGLLAACGGCSKSAQETQRVAASAPQRSETIAWVHWLGKDRLGADTNAAYLMSLWRMPEAAKLEAQTLDKLALAPWRFAGLKVKDGGKNLENGGHAATNSDPSTANSSLPTNSPQSALRALLDDIVAKESYLEARQAGTNDPVELAFAIRLSPERAAVWQTNLATAFESLVGTRPTPTSTGWALNCAAPLAARPSTLTLSRSNDWTVLTLCGTNHTAFTPFRSTTQSSTHPSSPTSRALWLEAELDASRLPTPLSILSSSNFTTLHVPRSTNSPRIALRVAGDGRNVHTEAELDFPQPLGLQLEPWNVPTNLIHDPLIGFMAVRGIRPWLTAQPFWSDLGLGTPPNQAYFWAQHGLPGFCYVASPSAQASNQVAKLGDFVLDEVNPLIARSPMKLGKFYPWTNSPGVTWRGFPMFWPNLGCTNLGGNPFILGAFSPTALTNAPAPEPLLQQLYGGTNLVCYDWERTGDTANTLGQLTQMARYLFNRARLNQTVSLTWLIAACPKLGPAVTGVTVTGANRLALHRSSTLGLTGMELQVFTDWLESPDFPLGLHTFTATPEPLPTSPQVRHATNSTPYPKPQVTSPK